MPTAEPLAEPQPPKTKQRPGPRHYNWAAAKRLWCSGEQVSVIAERLGMPKGSLYKKACLFNWPKRHEAHAFNVKPAEILPAVAQTVEREALQQVALQAPVISAAVRAQVADWLKRTLGNANRLQEHIESALERKVEVKDIQSLSASLETLDRVARRTLGLDAGPSGTVSGSLANVHQPWSGTPVIEVTTEPLPSLKPADQSVEGQAEASPVP